MKILFPLAAVIMLAAAPAMAQTWSSNAPKIGPVNQPEGILLQPYPASANYCPTGYQPITVGGVICCGNPNTGEVYSTPVSTPRRVANDCPAGVKGCQ